jgi:NADH:ubiquinone oxidoreductase subunit F (NADH-binding)
MQDIIDKIKNSKILGRSGSLYPVFMKWEAVKSSNTTEKYVICNGAEGEMETFKDYYLLKNHPEIVLDGVKIAVQELKTTKAFLYLKKSYFDEFYPILEKLIDDKIEIVEKKGGYIGGEETAVIEVIEGNIPEPRIKPPFPTEFGLWGKPTLVNNLETFYFISKINSDDYHNTRFFSIAGDASNKGVFEFDENITIKELLEKTNNIPSFDYFLQVGGGSSGQIILPQEIENSLDCLGSIIIYNRETTDPFLLMEKWINFFLEGNCDKCTPCREGLFRIKGMIEKKDFREIHDLFFVMEETSLCPLGKVATFPFSTLLEKIILEKNESNN